MDEAVALAAAYDVVLDATDNVLSRYVLNEACVRTGRPLVSGAALGWDGQLTTYAWRGEPSRDSAARGPCMRCVLPTPPPAAAVGSCDAGGVLGPVPGTIGTLQAAEALRLLLFPGEQPAYAGRMLLYAGRTGDVRVVRLRGWSSGCPTCGVDRSAETDYAALCGASCSAAAPIPADRRVTTATLAAMLGEVRPPLVVDVRPASFSAIHTLPGALCVPVADIDARIGEIRRAAADAPAVVCVCRRGNESQRAVRRLEEHGVHAVDLVGGLHAYSRDVDPTVPIF
jgi:adenylyltransferase/sulfurtransferase